MQCELLRADRGSFHEMVEAATDPYGGSNPGQAGFATSLTDQSGGIQPQEIGDLCEGKNSGFDDGPRTGSLDGSVARYWSENKGPNLIDGSCTTGVNPVAPVISSVSAQGTGIGTVIALQGDFGDDPGSSQDIAGRIAEVDGRMCPRCGYGRQRKVQMGRRAAREQHTRPGAERRSSEHPFLDQNGDHF